MYSLSRTLTALALCFCVRGAKGWIKREQQSFEKFPTQPDDGSSKINDGAVEFKRKRYSESKYKYIRHRTLEKISRHGDISFYDDDDITQGSSQSKRESHAGFLDEDFASHFEDMFDVLESDNFSLGRRTKGSKKSKSTKKSKAIHPKQSKTKKSKKRSRISERPQPKMTRPPAGA